MLFGGTFSFNGHPDFHNDGKTDNPRIGTTEDWVYFSFLASHPIHIHLINYQVISKVALKMFTTQVFQPRKKELQNVTCYYSEIDYYVQVGVIPLCSKPT